MLHSSKTSFVFSSFITNVHFKLTNSAISVLNTILSNDFSPAKTLILNLGFVSIPLTLTSLLSTIIFLLNLFLTQSFKFIYSSSFLLILT